MSSKLQKMAATNISRIISFVIVVLCCVLAFSIRLFSNVTNEPIIHEFDPHFNWRCTQYIDKHGLYEFLGWFDNISWYPQGRAVGETSYPGLMYTSAIIKWTLQKMHIMVNLVDICVYTGPSFSVLSVIVAFLFGQLVESSALGLTFAALTSFVPGMISRSVGGAYDYECISLFIIVLCMYTFALALKTGSLFWSTVAGLVYGYLALTWGGYVFVSNCIPLLTAGLVAIGQYSWRLHVSYSIWTVFGTLLTSSIPFIAEKTLSKPEHFAAIGVFAVLQIWGLFTVLKKYFTVPSYTSIVVSSIMILPIFLISLVTIGVSTGLLGGFSGRLMNMFDPSYATKKIPIIASVAEHQPTAWGKYFIDCGLLIVLFPVGCYSALRGTGPKRGVDEVKLLLLIYGLSTLYFASIMVRLVLVFTPAMVFVSGMGLHYCLKVLSRKPNQLLSMVTIFTIFSCCVYSMLHAVWFACYSYSSDHLHFPVLTPRGQESSDDYREGYRWLWSNTGRDERVMSWWDYGYQISSMGGRGCMADGNTNNFTHIGIIGMTMSSPEPVSWRLARLMGADYMLVIFGGAAQYSGDDINKFLWMPRIAHQTFDNITGEMYQPSPYEHIIGDRMTQNMTNSMMYRFCYNNFKRFQLHPSYPSGHDFIRMVKVPHLETIKLTHFQEAFTSKNWIVRIYKVMPDPLWNRVY
ncbi:Oligosaccharyl transferase STT3 subunit family protein [Tritrichomonas foetus]|uniref:dolichyl-diphosphooligosaccharide--protein glycotransferase n=1 Tax=Tritrichomonas foetus TaxID=1144522 RepID=A0A1J4J484_9EUKA|nr:Oligosaccharyl transferase STT3 subunit family protein [Tritrichomonas foetus]|eukprot:OHS92951.1 Oligosaccharyl transferase STT3 subunit family protein [Tritrichomonas foetus]